MYIFFKRLHLYSKDSVYIKHFRRYPLFLRQKDQSDWIIISIYSKLSEGFIREFKDSVDWYWISRKQKLSEGFIREFKDRVDWYWISWNQSK